VVALDDPNCLTVIQYAVDVLKVEHIIVCGHFGCGGVEAVLANRRLGLADRWLSHVREVKDKHWKELEPLDNHARLGRLCALNVIEQVLNVSRTGIVQEAWARGQKIAIHGAIYAIENGLLRDLGIAIAAQADAEGQYAAAIAKFRTGKN
jgi:carbonic anhydrase